MADYFGRKDSLWGGETVKVVETRVALDLVAGDKFRIEKSKGSFTLIPHPGNTGPWKLSHDKLNPIPITRKKHKPTDFERAYSMMVKTNANAAPRQLFLIERENGTVAITAKAEHPEGEAHSLDAASVER